MSWERIRNKISPNYGAWPTTTVTAKPKTSRQKQNTSRQKQKPHGKTKDLTAKPSTSQQKPNTLRQKQILRGKSKYPRQNQTPTAKPKTSRQKQNFLTAKPKTSQQNQRPHGETKFHSKNQIPHGKSKYFTAKATILDKIKWNGKPPSSQIKDEAARRAKTRHFPILDLGGRGDLGFPSILSKIVASPQTSCGVYSSRIHFSPTDVVRGGDMNAWRTNPTGRLRCGEARQKQTKDLKGKSENWVWSQVMGHRAT